MLFFVYKQFYKKEFNYGNVLIWVKFNEFLENFELDPSIFDQKVFFKIHYQSFFPKDIRNYKKSPLFKPFIDVKMKVLSKISHLTGTNNTYFDYFNKMQQH